MLFKTPRDMGYSLWMRGFAALLRMLAPNVFVWPRAAASEGTAASGPFFGAGFGNFIAWSVVSLRGHFFLVFLIFYPFGRSADKPIEGSYTAMIELTRLNGTPIVLNSDLIKTAEASPDTMLTLINGEKLIVREGLRRGHRAGAGVPRPVAGLRGPDACHPMAICSGWFPLPVWTLLTIPNSTQDDLHHGR